MLDLTQQPHRRYNPLTREWVLVSPHRTKRPWQGQMERVPPENQPPYDPDCYLCPGNSRAGGHTNPGYTSTFVFDNDFAALMPGTSAESKRDGLLIAEGEPGLCRVICFDPRHDLTLAKMEVASVRRVVDTWAEQFTELGSRPEIGYVQIFENRGAMMGCSNPHPHCQLWAGTSVPNEPAKELGSLRNYRALHSRCLLCDYLAQETAARERIVCENGDFVVMVPFWAVWPFETMLLSRRHVAGLDELKDGERNSLAEILHRITGIYDRLFDVSFPYSMGFHQRPTDGGSYPEVHLHAHFDPPLLRSATVRKFLVGYELLAMPQRDITPESAASRLRELDD
jgi:UDPglucose--hexose-1-phosphate uridylyltransferase